MQELYSNSFFWFFFFCFNTAVFLPVYLIHYPYSTFFPFRIPVRENGRGRFDFIFCKINQDIFRVSADLSLMVLTAVLLKGSFLILPLGIIGGIYFLLIVIYQITNSIFRKVYHKEFTNFELVQYLSLGYKIVRHSAIQQIAFIITLIILLTLTSCFFFVEYFNWMSNHPVSPATLFVLTVTGIILPVYTRLKVTTLVFSNKVFPVHVFELYKILFKSSHHLKEYRQVSKIDIDKLTAAVPPKKYQLHSRPNIFIIAIESYGRMVLDEMENPVNTYKVCIEKAEQVLNQKGFKIVSSLATSPVAGAGSWIAYSSFLYGINLKNQMIYEYILASEKINSYNHLFRMLQQNGYTNYRANAVGTSYDGVEIPWDKYSAFYAVDKWIHLKDMKYEGQMFGLGPSPSDQFILHHSLKLIKERSNNPFSFFLLTQNSHNPFFTLPDYYANWQDSNIRPEKLETKGAKLVSLPKISNYFKAIEYEMKTVSNFIAEEGNDNDIFIIFGDHQPPIFNEAKKGNETPVHIITKNESFLEEWKALGFKEGLMPSLAGTIFNFAGIYSIFQRAFLKSFSSETVLPEYEPDGKPLFHDEAT